MIETVDVESGTPMNKDELRALIHERAIMEGDFTLASGKQSRFYVDGKRIMFDPRGLSLMADAFLEAMRDCQPVAAVGGLEMGAIPIAIAIALRSAQLDTPIPAFFVRKSPKGHGTNSFIEGCLEKGSRVVICDDVMTTGGSALKAIRKVEEYGCEIIRVVCLVDREEGAAEAFADEGYDYRPIFKLSGIIERAGKT